MKYILVTGGVISGIGKGVIASSMGTILKACGIRVTSIKIDPYINIDAGTFSPYEHGEKFLRFVKAGRLLTQPSIPLCLLAAARHSFYSSGANQFTEPVQLQFSWRNIKNTIKRQSLWFCLLNSMCFVLQEKCSYWTMVVKLIWIWETMNDSLISNCTGTTTSRREKFTSPSSTKRGEEITWEKQCKVRKFLDLNVSVRFVGLSLTLSTHSIVRSGVIKYNCFVIFGWPLSQSIRTIFTR